MKKLKDITLIEGFEYRGRTEHGEDAKFTPFDEIDGYPKGYIDPFTWERGITKGAGKYWIDRARCKKCGQEVFGHPDSGMGAAVIGIPSFNEAQKNHRCFFDSPRDQLIKKIEELWNEGIKDPRGRTPLQLFEDILKELKK